jgi:hypothetical protein
MKQFFSVILTAAFLIWPVMSQNAASEEIAAKDLFFLNSLHYTAKGMEYWYSKENGGLELLSGVPYSDLGCKNCHVSGCDRCHKVETDGKAAYSTEAAKKEAMCLECHAREAKIRQIDKEAAQDDVHLSQGMECADCHSQREMHGDGVEYKSFKEAGAMDTTCENCHEDVTQSYSHTVHKDKLDCKSCHVRHVVSCSNCHFDSLVKEGKRVAIPVSGWVFLMNYKGKVTSANMQNFVVGADKTFLMFAPHMSHSITKDGRKCDACHGTDIANQVQKGKVTLTWLENGKVKNLKGVIPVADGVDYNCVYQDRKDEKWVPIRNPADPVLHYAAFGMPLSKKQIESLVKGQSIPRQK